MLFTGVIVGTVIVIAAGALWAKLPWYVQLGSLWSPLLTDVVATCGTVVLTAGISSSVTGLMAGLWAGLLFSLILFFGQKPLQRWAIRHGIEQDGWLARRILKDNPR